MMYERLLITLIPLNTGTSEDEGGWLFDTSVDWANDIQNVIDKSLEGRSVKFGPNNVCAAVQEFGGVCMHNVRAIARLFL
jgi:hypothetical protein